MLNRYLNIEGISDVRNFCLKEGRVFEIKKDDFFFRKGEAARFLGYVEKGAFRIINYTSAGKSQIVGYSFTNDFVTDYGSFINQTLTTVYAQAIEDCKVYAITLEQFNQCLDGSDIHLRRNFAESAFTEIYGRLVSLYCDTPEERYFKLIKESPELLDIVHLKEVASFIGVTPETLSRIRNKMKSTDS